MLLLARIHWPFLGQPLLASIEEWLSITSLLVEVASQAKSIAVKIRWLRGHHGVGGRLTASTAGSQTSGIHAARTLTFIIPVIDPVLLTSSLSYLTGQVKQCFASRDC